MLCGITMLEIFIIVTMNVILLNHSKAFELDAEFIKYVSFFYLFELVNNICVYHDCRVGYI